MAKKLSEGVGKKIVEALKKQSEIEITPISPENTQEAAETSFEEMPQAFVAQNQEEEDFLEKMASDTYSMNQPEIEEEPTIKEETFVSAPPPQPATESFIKELDNFEVPSNIAVLKKLIAQLPSGVNKSTGALIIKQTMEALGISMKSVLQEAQQVQEGLNSSAKECFSTIQEYKKQIVELEKQAQNHQKQYAALNELISLFVQTGV